jgi:MerC mercury resistance protein
MIIANNSQFAAASSQALCGTKWVIAGRAAAAPLHIGDRPGGGFPVDEKVSPVAPQSWVDSLGASVSIACAIQCTLFPLLIGVLPLVGLGFLAGDGVEKVFLVTSIVLAVGSFSWGFRHHKNLYVFLFLIGGLLLIFTGRAWVDENFEISFVVSGTLVLAAGHLLNRRLCRLCVVCEASRTSQRD